ncbi:glycine zipper 2TM domain-containing protein [Xinfangfangia sp. D13-10-4-6]|uniref:glycine zipper 2TM domain-containing protein n=1 Tax=Pseudogemmobacter hezensis TaxID=2737662 RepID=UPI001551EF88|nr:glycine zipper 2TM domain-containing protein [Pseudogemmobacter hezensis]NPD15996.1 glycine zipper 2TM domain-containing protein [Pseudogemmobacter hezensis]
MKFSETLIGRSLGRGVIVLTLSATVLAGCDEQIVLAPGAVDANDSCGKYVTTIAEARQTDINKQAQNAAAGAVFGALLGAAVSSSDDRLKGALAGAAVGGLAGFSATYYNQKRANAQDARALLSSVNQDASKEQVLVTRTGAAVAELRRCRNGQAAQLASGIKSGKVDKANGRKQLAVLKKRIATDNKVISASFNGIGQRVDSYVDATAATASVTRAQVLAASNASARNARAATPAVSKVTTSTKNMTAQDAKAAKALESSISSIEKLLG